MKDSLSGGYPGKAERIGIQCLHLRFFLLKNKKKSHFDIDIAG